MTAPRVGVLALQGSFANHVSLLQRLDVRTREIRHPDALAEVESLILPGGESTTLSKLLIASGLFDAISARLDNNTLVIFGTCAGMILCAREILDGTQDQQSFGIFDAAVRRNGIGRQQRSHERELRVTGLDTAFRGVFIRPPVVEQWGSDVEVLAEADGSPVLCRQGRHMYATFHPELTTDTRVHQLFLGCLGQ